MKLLLINPKFPESFWSFSWLFQKIITDKKVHNPPLGLATVAALTPGDWEIRIIDENVEEIDWEAEATIVGVCGMQVQFERQKEIVEHFRKRGCHVVVGGSYASLCPEVYETVADTVVSGEAEYIWPRFCTDFEKGVSEKLYRETGEVSLRDSPIPRYDLIKVRLYDTVALQFSRGCPFRCEFCDIIVMFGRKPRTKSLEQIGHELDMLRRLGIWNTFFVDDNLIGHLPECRRLLAFLAEYQEKHDYRFNFGTEASINMASDRELLRLFRDAHFSWVFIGIESPSEEALIETRKTQNTRLDLLESLRTIYAYGIMIYAGFIVGFDADDRTIFDRQYRFLLSSGIIVAMVGLLVALPKTPLYERLEKAGRLDKRFAPDNTGSGTNVIPLRMRYDELVAGYKALQIRLTREPVICDRIRNKLDYLGEGAGGGATLPIGKQISYLTRFFVFGLLFGGFKTPYYFLKSLLPALRKPRLIPAVIADWILGLSIKNFVDRRMKPPANVGKEAVSTGGRTRAGRLDNLAAFN